MDLSRNRWLAHADQANIGQVLIQIRPTARGLAADLPLHPN
jgi:hypothetical protein